MTAQGGNQSADTKSFLTASKFPLLRRLSFVSLAAMLITAATLIFLYWQDQFAEHKEIAARDNEKSAIHFAHQLGGQINDLISVTEGLDERALRANPKIDVFTAELEKVHGHDFAKLKIYNLSGKIAYSSVKGEIGTSSGHPELLDMALRGEARHLLSFRKTFMSSSGELHDRYIASTYLPLIHAEKVIGVIELYTDATHFFERTRTNLLAIALIVFCAFSVLYVALFFYVRRTDRAIAAWQKLVVDSETSYRSLFDNMLEGFAYCRMLYDDHNRPVDFVYLSVNEAFGRLTGLKNVINKQVSEVIPGILEQNPELFEIYNQVALTGIPQKFDLDLKQLDKCLAISVYSSEKGFFVVVFDDITERKHIEEKLRKMTESLEVKVIERRDQVRTLSAQLAMTEERERRILAQELHDNLGQLLAIIKIKLTSFVPGSLQSSVNQVVELVDKADQSARMITIQLSPPILHTLGLAAALEGLREEMECTFGLAVHICSEGDLKSLADWMQAVLYRSARELLINVAKHAKVGDANLFCTFDGSQVTLVVGDDGCGFDTAGFPDTLPERPSFGLRSIYERITNIGGEMEIDSNPGNGTTTTLTVPYPIVEEESRR